MGRSGVDGPAAVREALDCRWYWSSPTSSKLKKVFADTFRTKGQVAFEGGAEQRQVPQTRVKRVSAAPRQNQEGR